jgi:hypothetical protein
MRPGPLLLPPNLLSVLLLAPWLAAMDLIALQQRGHNDIAIVSTMTTSTTINVNDTQCQHHGIAS